MAVAERPGNKLEVVGRFAASMVVVERSAASTAVGGRFATNMEEGVVEGSTSTGPIAARSTR